MRKYTFELTVTEGCDEFWEGLQEDGTYRGYATCEEVEDAVLDALHNTCITDFELTLRKFTNE